MHGRALVALPGVACDRRLADGDHLFDDIELAEPVGSRRFASVAAGSSCFCRTSWTWRSQLSLKPRTVAPQRRQHAAATIVPADDDVAHLRISTANCRTDKQFRSVTTRLAIFRWTNNSPGRPTISLAGTRLSEPANLIDKSASAGCESLTKKSGSCCRMRPAQALLLSKR